MKPRKLFSYTADNTMQRDDFCEQICEIATKFSYLDWMFSLISNSSPDLCYCGDMVDPYREDLC